MPTMKNATTVLPSITKYYKVLLRTTLYYKVLDSTTKQRTTCCYKTKHSVLQLVPCTTKYPSAIPESSATSCRATYGMQNAIGATTFMFDSLVAMHETSSTMRAPARSPRLRFGLWRRILKWKNTAFCAPAIHRDVM